MNEGTRKSNKKSTKKGTKRSHTPARTKGNPNENSPGERPVVHPYDNDEPDAFGQSLYAANLEDASNSAMVQNPVGAKERYNPMKGYLIPVNPAIKPTMKENNAMNPMSKIMGPIPPPFRAKNQGPDELQDARRPQGKSLPPLKGAAGAKGVDGASRLAQERLRNIPPLTKKPDYKKFVVEDTFYSEQEGDLIEGKVNLQKKGTIETVNFLKENINHKGGAFEPLIYDPPEPEYVRPVRVKQQRSQVTQLYNPQQKKDMVPVQQDSVIPQKKEFVDRPPVEVKGPEQIDWTPRKGGGQSQAQAQQQNMKPPEAPEELFKNDNIPAQPRRPKIPQLQQQEYIPRKKLVEPLEGFQVPVIAEQDPKKLFEDAEPGYIAEDSLVGARRAKSYANTVFLEPEAAVTREPSYLPSFNWEPVQVQKNYYNIPEQLKVYGAQQVYQGALFVPENTFLNNPSAYEEDNKQPTAYKRLVLAFVKQGDDGRERRAYNFNLSSPMATIFDLKEAIMNDFGYDISQQRIFQRYLEVHNGDVIANLPFEHPEEVMIFGNIGDPTTSKEGLPRKLREKTMTDIRQINCSNLSPDEFANMTAEENLVLPPYRDWNEEWQQLYKQATELRAYVAIQQYVTETREMADLLEFEQRLVSLLNNFKAAAVKSVQMIEKQQVQPVYLDNLFGKGGSKYVIGGMLIRECRNWILLAKDLGEGSLCYKVAANECRAFDFVRGKIPYLRVPLCCLINYRGTGYFVQSICPITQKSLIYGSNTEGIDIMIQEAALEGVLQISKVFNINEHVVYDRVVRVGKHLSLAYDCELHEGEDENLYMLNAARMLAPDVQDDERLYEINGKFLRPEFQSEYCSDEIESNNMLCTWKNPTKCEGCDQFITDYEYYYYEKRSVNKERTLYVQYYYCQSCYARLKPINGFKIGADKLIRKVVPFAERMIYWYNLQTGEISTKRPSKKISLNPDANIMFPEFSQGAERDYIQKENIEDQRVLMTASKALRTDVLRRFIIQLNNLEITVRSSREFSTILHERGINIRYLGAIAAEATHNFIKEAAIREILARSIKVLIRDGLDFLKRQTNKDYDTDAKKFVIYYLNEVFTLTERESSLNIWQLLTELVYNKFELHLDKSILTRLHLPALIYRISQVLNLSMSKVQGFNFEDANPFNLADLISIQPKVKIKLKYPLCIDIFLKTAREKDSLGKRTKWYFQGGPERAQATEIFREAAIVSAYVYGKESVEAGEIQKEFAMHLEERHAENGKPEFSQWNKCANLLEDELSLEAREFYQKAIYALTSQYGHYEPLVADCLVSLACLNKIKQHNQEEINHEITIKYLLSAIEIFDIVVSADHPDTAELCVKIALAYKEAKLVKEAFSWIQRAFCTFYRIFGPDDEVTIQIFDHTRTIGLFTDPEITRVPIEDMCEYIESRVFNTPEAPGQ